MGDCPNRAGGRLCASAITLGGMPVRAQALVIQTNLRVAAMSVRRPANDSAAYGWLIMPTSGGAPALLVLRSRTNAVIVRSSRRARLVYSPVMRMGAKIEAACRRAAEARFFALQMRFVVAIAAMVLFAGVVQYVVNPPPRRGGAMTAADGIWLAVLAVGFVTTLALCAFWRRTRRRAHNEIESLRAISPEDAAALIRVPWRVLMNPGRAATCSSALAIGVILIGIAVSIGGAVSVRYEFLLCGYAPLLIGSYLSSRSSRAVRTVLAAGPGYACLNCGYRREGLPRDRECPECGTRQSLAQWWFIKRYWGESCR